MAAQKSSIEKLKMRQSWQIPLKFVGSYLILHNIALAAIALSSLIVGVHIHFQDIDRYYVSGRALMQGQIPYRDFDLEYPPLSLLPMIIPHLLATGNEIDFFTYSLLFLVEIMVFSSAIMWTLARILIDLHGPTANRSPLRTYVLSIVLTAHLIAWRYDLFPALLTALAFAFALSKKPALTGACLVLGGAAKLYPLVLWPIFMVFYLARRDTRGLLHLMAGTIASATLMVVPLLAVGPDSLMSFVRYHLERGVQFEAVAASPLLLARALGLIEVDTEFSHGAFHLVSPLVPVVLAYLPYATLVLLGVVIVGCYASFKSRAPLSQAQVVQSLAAYILAALLAFIITSKVFSPQYFAWLLPFIPLLRRAQIGLMLVLMFMTFEVLTPAWAGILGFQLVPVLLLMGRNALVVALLVWLLVEHRPRRREGTSAATNAATVEAGPSSSRR